MRQNKSSCGQMALIEDHIPLQINDSLTEKVIEDKASVWVHSNVLKRSQIFGAAFEGCDRVPFDFILRIDQKMGAMG